MTETLAELRVSAGGLVVVLGGGILLYAALRWLRGLLATARMGASRRRLVARLRPMAETVIFVGYLVVSTPLVVSGRPAHAALVLGATLVVLVSLAWFALRDAAVGMFLKAGELCAPGDLVEVDGLRGRVRSLGFRVLAIETDEGRQAFVPYSRIGRQSIVRVASVDGAHRHGFVLPRPPGLAPDELRALVRRAALRAHFCSPARAPEVELSERDCAVTVWALDADRAPAVEAAVRDALSRAGGGAANA